MYANTLEPKERQSSLPSESVSFQNPHSGKKRKKTSITGAYLLMHSVHGKLSEEASKTECDLRRLVGHANLFDSLTMTFNDSDMENKTLPDQTTKPKIDASLRGTRITEQNCNHDTASSSHGYSKPYSCNSDFEDCSDCDSESSSDSDLDSDSEISWSSSESDSGSDSELNWATKEHHYDLPDTFASSKTLLVKLNLEASENDG